MLVYLIGYLEAEMGVSLCAVVSELVFLGHPLSLIYIFHFLAVF